MSEEKTVTETPIATPGPLSEDQWNNLVGWLHDAAGWEVWTREVIDQLANDRRLLLAEVKRLREAQNIVEQDLWQWIKEKARDHRYSDEWIGNALRAAIGARASLALLQLRGPMFADAWPRMARALRRMKEER